MTVDIDELMRTAVRAATYGAEVAMKWQGRGAERAVRQKSGPRDLVSRADLETESAIRDVLGNLRPDDSISGEEQTPVAGSSGIRWLIDPIDGTTSYVYGRCGWAVSVAAVDGSDRVLAGVVAEPAHDRLSVAGAGRGAWAGDEPLAVRRCEDLANALVEINFGRPDQHPNAGAMVDSLVPHVRDVRRSGSAAAALTDVASGRADAVWGPGLQPWDGTAGLLLVREAGGQVGDLGGPTDDRWPTSGDVLAASPALWSLLRDLLAAAYGS